MSTETINRLTFFAAHHGVGALGGVLGRAVELDAAHGGLHGAYWSTGSVL
jgi:hypothetical protein